MVVARGSNKYRLKGRRPTIVDFRAVLDTEGYPQNTTVGIRPRVPTTYLNSSI